MSELLITGGCRCGKIRFEFHTENLSGGAICACVDCQRASGAVLNHAVAANSQKFKLLQGQDTIKSYDDIGESGKKVSRFFCGECGSQLFAKPQSYPDFVSVRVPSLDKKPEVAPKFAIYLNNIPSWVTLPEEMIEEGKKYGG